MGGWLFLLFLIPHILSFSLMISYLVGGWLFLSTSTAQTFWLFSMPIFSFQMSLTASSDKPNFSNLDLHILQWRHMMAALRNNSWAQTLLLWPIYVWSPQIGLRKKVCPQQWGSAVRCCGCHPLNTLLRKRLHFTKEGLVGQTLMRAFRNFK